MRIYRVFVLLLVLCICVVGVVFLAFSGGFISPDAFFILKDYSFYIGIFCIFLSFTTACLDRSIVRERGIEIPLELGNLRILREAIEHFLKKSMEAESFVRSCTVNIHYKKGVNVYVKCAIFPEKEVMQLTGFLQQKVVEELNKIGIKDIGQVHILVKRLLTK